MAAKYILLILNLVIVVKGKQEGFIVGGDTVSNIRDFAFCASLFIDSDVRCGSSILNQVILITAAHCLEDAKQITANVGNINRDEGTARNVENFMHHKAYSEVTIHNDIGLCKVHPPLRLSQAVKRVVVMRSAPAVAEGEVAGWGLVNERMNLDTTLLKHTKQKLWSHKKCKYILKKVLPEGTICGGQRRSSSNFASAGDSGGPLVIRKLIQVGLVSFKVPEISSSLVIYTELSHFYDWIQQTTLKLTCKS